MEVCSIDERLQQETLCRRQWTDEYVKRQETLMRQNLVVVWLQSLMLDVVSHVLFFSAAAVIAITGTRALYKTSYHSSHQQTMTEKCRFLFLAEVKQVSVQFWVVGHGPFPVGVPLVLTLCLQRISRY